MHPTSGRLCALGVALVLVLAGCSSGEATDEAADSATTASPLVEENEASSTTTEAIASAETTSTTSAAPEPEGPGVDDSAIRLGLSVDLSGPLSAVDSFVLDAQIAYFDRVNASGGIDGRMVEVVALDHASDEFSHVDNVQELLESSERGVAMITSVGGDDFAQAVVEVLAEANVIGISRGHVDAPSPAMQRHVLRIGQSTCENAYEGVSRLVHGDDGEDVASEIAIIARSGSYGERSAAGARLAAEAAGVENIVSFDGEITDETIGEVIDENGGSVPNHFWVAVSPAELRDLLLELSAADAGFEIGGAFQSHDALLLESSVAPVLSAAYVHTSPIEPFDHDDGRSSAIREAFPDSEYLAADSLAFGWQQAELAHEILMAAADRGDLTRAGITAVAQDLSRETVGSLFFSIDAEQATLRNTLSEPGSTGLVSIPGPEDVSAAANEACSNTQ